MNIVGLSANSHDSACCLLRDGRIVAAAEEERFTRRKHDPALPRLAFRYCLDEAGLTIADIDCIGYFEDPVKKLGRQVWMGALGSTYEMDRLSRLDARRPERGIRQLLGYDGPIHFFDHHQAHAASSYCFSGFPEAAVLTVDGVGEWATTTYGRGRGKDLEIFEEVEFPDSLGLMYSAVTGYLGFSVNDGEYKVMGLAPYGKPVYADKIRELVTPAGGGQYRLNLRYFDFVLWDRMYSEALEELMGAPARRPGSEIEEFHCDVARSLQMVLEETLLEKAMYIYSRVPSDNLCLAGGVALNCVANSRLLRDGPFHRMFVQPAANDAGGAIGAAALAHVRLTGQAMPLERLRHAYLGPTFSTSDVRGLIDSTAIDVEDYAGCEDELVAAAARRLAGGQVIGWHQGRMEFGPRALGARSILADPRRPEMRDRINALVKKREAFRPFAPAVLSSRAAEHFDLDHDSPFMLETCQVRSPLSLPSITHVDNSARVQTVDSATNPRFARLLEAFERLTGCPILLNTSFNMRDEPIVCTPLDSLLCFVRSEIDALVIEEMIIDRSAIKDSWRALLRYGLRPPAPAVNYRVYTML